MVKKELVSENKFNGFTKKEFVFRPDKKNQVFSYDMVKRIYNEFIKSLPKNSRNVVRGLNILGDTTLKGYNQDFKTVEEYDDYIKGKVTDETKFQFFYNITITVLEDTTTENMFTKRKK